MYARVTTFKIDPARRAESEAVVNNEILPKVEALPGLKSLVSAVQDDGNGIGVAVYESEDAANAVADHVAAIWSALGDYLIAPPSASGYTVMLHVQKD